MEINSELERLGARVQPAWLQACARHLQAGAPGFQNSSAQQKAKLVLQQLLHSDLNKCGAASLPSGVQGMHDTTLPGKLLLQVDEVVNIGAAIRERYNGNDGNSRCLKLLLTDGVQQVAAMEYRPTPALHSTMPAGTKLAVHNVLVRRGILLLTPQTCMVVGGQVEELEQARQRMVAHWAQPAVGRRGPPPSMQQATAAATQAAWSSSHAAVGAALPRPPQQQMVQGPAHNHQQQSQQQQQQQPHALPLRMNQQQVQQQQQGARQSQQPTQLLSQQQPLPAGGLPNRPGAAAAGGGQQQQQQQPGQPPPIRPAPSIPSGVMQHPPGRGSSGLRQQPHPASGIGLQQQEQREAAGHHASSSGRMLGAGAVPPPVAPLHERNGDAAPSGGQKRSRLALPKPPTQQPAASPPIDFVPETEEDFSFAAPPQQNPQQQPGTFQQLGAPRPLARPPPQLLQRLRQGVAAGAAAGAGATGLAAGTENDPICLDDEDAQLPPQQLGGFGAGSSGVGSGSRDGGEGGGGPTEVAMRDAVQQDGGTWEYPGDDSGCSMDEDGEAQPQGPQLDPWEQGYEEGYGDDGQAAAEDYEMAAADDEGQEGGTGGSGSWQDDEVAGDEEQQAAAVQGEEGVPLAAGEGEGGDGSEDGWEEGDEQQPAETEKGPLGAPTAKAAGIPAAVGAAVPSAHVTTAGQMARRRSSGRAAEQLPQPEPVALVAAQQQQPADGVPSSQRLSRRLSGSKRPQSPPAAPGASALDSAEDNLSASSSRMPGQAACAEPPLSADGQQQQQQQDSQASPAPAAPAPTRSAPHSGKQQQAEQLGPLSSLAPQPVDPDLLAAAPSLAEVLHAKPRSPLLPPPVAGARPAGGAGSGRALPSVPPLQQQQQAGGSLQPPARPSLLRLRHMGGPPAAAPPPAAPSVPPAPAMPAAGDSDDDMPSFGLLDDCSPVRQQAGAAPASSSGWVEEPFTYLLLLRQKVASAAPPAFPLTACIFATVKTFVGRLRFKDPQTGEPLYGMEMLVEDGSMVAKARLGSQFMREFFDLEPQEFEACLADPLRRVQAAQLAKGLQQVLASFSGLMAVRLEAPGCQLEVTNLLQPMNEQQVAALQQRANHSFLPCR